MDVSLTPQLEDFVRRKVESGQFESSSEVIREALRLLAARDADDAAKLDALRAEIRKGLESGPATELDFENVRRKARAGFNAAG
jgi:antitoxin ParD1/3/4